MIILIFIFQKLKLNFNFLKYINLEKQNKTCHLNNKLVHKKFNKLSY